MLSYLFVNKDIQNSAHACRVPIQSSGVSTEHNVELVSVFKGEKTMLMYIYDQFIILRFLFGIYVYICAFLEYRCSTSQLRKLKNNNANVH